MCRILLYSFVITQLLSSFINAAVYPECENETVGNFIPVTSNCSKAIYCDGEDSSIVECDYDRPYFSPNDQNCYTDSSTCGNRPFGEGENLATESTSTSAIPISRPTTPSTTMSILTRPTTIGISSTTATTAAATSTIFTTAATRPTIPTTTVGIPTNWPTIVTTSSIITTSTATVPSSLTCPPVDDPSRPVFLPHPKSCSQYYLCYHGVATLMQCPNMLHFDVTQQSCNTAEKVHCQISAVKPRDQCLPQTVDVYPHASNCNYYYLCEYGYLMVMQCPFNMGWDYEKRACAVKSKAKCYNEAFVN